VGSDSLKDLAEKTLVFATKDHAKELNSQVPLLKHVKLVFIDGLNHWLEEQPLTWLQAKIATAAAEEGEPSPCQVVATANENTPKLREFLFLNLGEHEAFIKLPNSVDAKTPKQFAHALPAVQKFQVLLGHIKTHKPSCSVVVANTRTVAEWIAYKLQGNGVQVFLLTRPVGAEQRRALVEAYSQNKTTQNTGEKISVIVATDEAFQHMGIEGLQCIYQFDVPRSPQIFLARLSRIEGTGRPLSITFICEDYGFYMGAIEDTLGFKVAVLKPDPKYFTIADTSDYPLETDGRVKRLDGTSAQSSQPKLRLVDQTADVAAAPRPRSEARREEPRRDEHRREEPRRDEHQENRTPRAEPRLQPRPVPAAAPRVAAVAARATETSPRLMPRAAAAQSGVSEASGAHRDKFTHRDERVKDLAQAMKQAAQNRTQPSPAEQNMLTPKPLLLPKTAHGGLSGLALALTDAVKAGVKASSEAFLEGLQAHGGSLVPAPISLAWDFFKEKVLGKSPNDDDKPKDKSSR
jgi:superfamily II DNA/RNA helicase